MPYCMTVSCCDVIKSDTVSEVSKLLLDFPKVQTSKQQVHRNKFAV